MIPLCQSGMGALSTAVRRFRPVGRRKRRRMIGGVVRERLHGTRVPVEVYLWSRIGIWLAALFSLAWFEPKPPPLRHRWDSPFLHDLGYAQDVWAGWASGWYSPVPGH